MIYIYSGRFSKPVFRASAGLPLVTRRSFLDESWMEQPGEVEKVLMGSLIPGNGARIFTFFIKRALHLPRVLILRTTAFFRSKIGGSAGVSTCVCVCVENASCGKG